MYTRTLDFTVVYKDTGMYTKEAFEREISSDVRTPIGAINDRKESLRKKLVQKITDDICESVEKYVPGAYYAYHESTVVVSVLLYKSHNRETKSFTSCINIHIIRYNHSEVAVTLNIEGQ